MAIPGFSAVVSLYSSKDIGRAHLGVQQTDQLLYPAQYIDPTCLSSCKKDCGAECAGTTGQARSWCIFQCAQDNRACNAICTRPGSPSQPTGEGNSSTTHIWEADMCVDAVQDPYPYATQDECNRNCEGGGCLQYGEVWECGFCVEWAHCRHYDGECTGFHFPFWDPAPTSCVTTDSGYTKCVSSWMQFPWVVECDNGSRTEGSSFCLS